MSKRNLRAKPLALNSAPLLLTDLHVSGWRDGVLFLDVESGPEKGTLALGPNAVCYLWQAVAAAMSDNVSPFSRRPPQQAKDSNNDG
ncbi:MAG: hypothetical protein K2X34_06100 [Hyphomonadaceae bacterium]|nr:hypothetical protein [Hyphomonadaceae bacterium]